MKRIEIRLQVFIDYPDDITPVSHREAILLREYCEWLDEVGMNLATEGDVGLQSGSIKWRRVPGYHE